MDRCHECMYWGEEHSPTCALALADVCTTCERPLGEHGGDDDNPACPYSYAELLAIKTKICDALGVAEPAEAFAAIARLRGTEGNIVLR